MLDREKLQDALALLRTLDPKLDARKLMALQLAYEIEEDATENGETLEQAGRRFAEDAEGIGRDLLEDAWLALLGTPTEL